ncbi:MAG TPA: ATP-binding protein, partial [bacterium]|nr:ATP-binding protein [bacterium]
FAIFSNINMGVMILNGLERVYVNKYAQQFETILDELQKEIMADISAKGRWSEKKINEMWLSYTVMPYVESQSVIIFSDVTSIRKREEELEHSERMASIGKLTASIAHEIKNPLTSLIGASELMFASSGPQIQDQGESVVNDQLIDIIRREGNRVKTLLDSLFRYTEELKYSMSPCGIHDILNDVSILFKLGHPGVAINSNVEDLKIFADAERMKEVFWNILVNSSEAMAEKGKISVYSKMRNKNVQIIFDDTGPGFIEKNIDRIFDPFFSTKRRGTGLGLAQVYRIVTRHGGSVKAMNTGNGARVIVELILYKDGDENGK